MSLAMMSSILALALVTGDPQGNDPQARSLEGDVVLVAAAVHVGDGKVHRPGWVALSKGRVQAVGALQNGQLPASAPKGFQVIQLGDRELMPGMVDAVAYAGLLRGTGQNEETSEMTPSTRVSRALVAGHASFQDHLATGVTSMVVQPGTRNVMGGLACLVKTHGETRDGILVKDAVGLRFTLGMDPAAGNRASRRGGGPNMWSRRPLSRMSVVYMIRSEFERAISYRDRRAAGEKVAPDADLDLLVQAMKGEIQVFWHARSERDIRTAIRLAREFRIPNNVLLEAHEIDTVKDEVAALGAKVLMGPLYHPQYRGRSRGAFGAPFMATDGTLWPVRPKTEAEARFMVHQVEHEEGDDCTTCVVGQPCAIDCSDCGGLLARLDCQECGTGTDCGQHGTLGLPAMGDGFAEQAFAGTKDFGIEAANYDPDEESRSACLACCGLGFSPALPDENGWGEALSVNAMRDPELQSAFARGGSASGETLLDFARFAVRVGVAPDRALAMVTGEPARLLGLDDRVGRLSKGLDADLLILSGDPLAPTSAIETVLVGGRVAMDATGNWNSDKE